MADKSRIEWTDATWNPVVGCSRVSAGCDGCYAIDVAKGMERKSRGMCKDGGTPKQKALLAAYDGLTKDKARGLDWAGIVRCRPELLDQPLRWRKPRRIFVNSMSDLFHPSVPFEFIAAVVGVMAACPKHTFQVLTKRPGRMAEWFVWVATGGLSHHCTKAAARAVDGIGFSPADECASWPLPNVWLGVSVEDQAALPRLDDLRRCPAAVRFVSFEPLLGDVEGVDLTGIGWTIVGGESGPGARPMHPDYARSLRDQCAAAGVPFFFKQNGAWLPTPMHLLADYEETARMNGSGMPWWEEGGHALCMVRVGKKAAGRLLDGRTHDEWPELPHPAAPDSTARPSEASRSADECAASSGAGTGAESAQRAPVADAVVTECLRASLRQLRACCCSGCGMLVCTCRY